MFAFFYSKKATPCEAACVLQNVNRIFNFSLDKSVGCFPSAIFIIGRLGPGFVHKNLV